MSDARELVAQLQAEAGQQEQLLAQKQMEAQAALQKITDTIQSAGVKRDEMQDLRSTIANENVALTTRYRFTFSFFRMICVEIAATLHE